MWIRHRDYVNCPRVSASTGSPAWVCQDYFLGQTNSRILWHRPRCIIRSKIVGLVDLEFILGLRTGIFSSHHLHCSLKLFFSQFVTTIVILFLVGLHFKSPHNPSVSEWDACDRPLGVWAALWLIRVALASFLCFWEYKRDRHDQL